MAQAELDIRHENLDEFLLERLNKATNQQLESIPPALKSKVIHSRGFTISPRLREFEKLYVLSLLGTSVYFHIEDDEKGMDKESFLKLKKINKMDGPLPGVLAEDQHSKGYIVFSNEEITNALRYARGISISKNYRLVKKIGTRPAGKRDKKHVEYRAYMRWLINSMIKYESGKKSFFQANELEHSDWYALLFFSKEEGSYKDFMASEFANTYGASVMSVTRALKRLSDRKLLVRTGRARLYRYTITSDGMDILDKMFKSFLS